jgi:hypothetical protein
LERAPENRIFMAIVVKQKIVIMENENEKPLAENRKENVKESVFKRFLNFLKMNPVGTTIVVSLIIIASTLLYFSSKSKRLEFNHKTTVVHLKDSLSSHYMESNVRIFTWAIRSELSRGNLEQVEQFFVNYLQTGKIVKVQLVDPTTSLISLSTDKKDIDQVVDFDEILTATLVVKIDKENTYLLANPVMGLDRKIGIVVVEIER